MSWFTKPAPITAQNKRAVQWIAECMAFHWEGRVDNWRNWEIEARNAIVAQAACDMIKNGKVNLADVQLSE